MMHKAFIALGSNLLEPQRQILRAFKEIKKLPETRLLKYSSLYRSEPVGYQNQPEFINAAAEVETGLTPHALLHALLALENTFGRERPFANAPRVLDLDLLLYNAMVMDSDELTLPHPRMHTRGFVLLPLAEIAPDLVMPKYGKISELALKCDNQGVEKIKNEPLLEE